MTINEFFVRNDVPVSGIMAPYEPCADNIQKSFYGKTKIYPFMDKNGVRHEVQVSYDSVVRVDDYLIPDEDLYSATTKRHLGGLSIKFIRERIKTQKKPGWLKI